MGRLDEKVAIVTGGARGMGEGEVRRFVEEGARVVIADVRVEEGRRVAEDLGEAARFAVLDVSREQDWMRVVEETLAEFGRIDVLINNAGIIRMGSLSDVTLEDYQAVIDVNQTGVFLGMRAMVEPMSAAGGGSIVNVSSIGGIVGTAGQLPYIASKFAVRGMTKAAALELADRNIRVNSMHPGFFETPMAGENPAGADSVWDFARQRVPLGRIGKPRDVADLAVFLASGESSYITGAEFVIDGGMLAGERQPSDWSD